MVLGKLVHQDISSDCDRGPYLKMSDLWSVPHIFVSITKALFILIFIFPLIGPSGNFSRGLQDVVMYHYWDAGHAG